MVRAYMGVFSKKGSSLLEQLQGWQKAREEYGFHVGFLSEKLVDYREVIDDLALSNEELSLEDLDLSLGLELFDNSSEEDAYNAREDNDWYNEVSLFDHSIPSSEIVLDESDSNYFYARGELNTREEDLELNPNPTSAFDVFVSTKHKRTKVLRAQADTFSAITAGTTYSGKERVLAQEIRKHFTAGSGTLIIVGKEMLRVPNINCSEDDLNWLDLKLINK